MSTDTRGTILMLGGSQAQVVAIDRARELGYRTVLCDYLPDNPGQFHADTFYQVSTIDKEAVLEVARAEHVDGVVAYASEPASPSAAYVAEQLGLPGNPYDAVVAMADKHLFRQRMEQAGIPCPSSVSCAAGTPVAQVETLAADLTLPLVVKPTDSSGSRGVTVVRDLSQLAPALSYAAEFSRGGTLIIEEFVERTFPYVIGGDIFVVDGEVVFWGLMSCLRHEEVVLVPVGERTPTGLTSAQYARVQDVLQRLVSSLGIRFGELNVEVLVGRDDTPYVIELASRAGGNMIPVQLSDVSGCDLVAANILAAMGDDPGDLHFSTADASPCMTYVLHALTEGTYQGFDLSDYARQYLYRSVIYVHEGDVVHAFTGAQNALGMLFFRLPTVDEQERFIRDIRQHVQVRVQPGA